MIQCKIKIYSLFYNNFSLITYIACNLNLVQECQERTKTQNCYEIRDRGTCLISNDPRTDYAGPCGWCGDKCGNDNVCEPVAFLKSNNVNNGVFEDCLKVGETTTATTTTAKGWSMIIMYNVTISLQ